MRSYVFILLVALIAGQCSKNSNPVQPLKTERLVIDTVRAQATTTQGEFYLVYRALNSPATLEFYSIFMGDIGVATIRTQSNGIPIPADEYQHLETTLPFSQAFAVGDTISAEYHLRGVFDSGSEFNASDSMRVVVK